MGRLGKLTLAAFGVVAAGFVFRRTLLPKVEEPRYDLEESRDGFEIRRYAPRILAETVVEGGFRRSLGDGFRRLARYIFGSNRAHREIAMTAPVGYRCEERIDKTVPLGFADSAAHHVVSFTMPAKYSMETLPSPMDERIRLRSVPERRVAALCFSGRANERVADSKRQELFDRLAQRGLLPESEPVLAQYDPPWIPSFLRRNEILVDIGEAPMAHA